MSYRSHRLLTGVKVLAFVCLLICAGMAIPEAVPAHAGDTGLPDLLIESITSCPEMPGIGTVMTVSAVIANRGEIASVPCPLTFTINEDTIHTVMLESISAGTTQTITFTWNAKAGDHVLIGTIDPENTASPGFRSAGNDSPVSAD